MAKNRRILFPIALLAFFLLLAGCAASRPAGGGDRPLLAPWPEADLLFQGDPCWLGGDGAMSVPLSQDRVLWLFGDSFVCGSAPCTRRTADIVRNSIALEPGHDPSGDKASFFWGKLDGAPAAFFRSEKSGEWLWPSSAVSLGQEVLIFFYRVREDENPLGFAPCGHRAALLENTSGPPDSWKAEYRDLPDNPFGVLLGAAALVDGDFVYAYGLGEGPGAPVFLARWPLAGWRDGDPGEACWWAGPELGFLPQSRMEGGPAAVMAGGQNEFFVGRSASGGLFCVQSLGFGAADVAWRTAAHLAGPWTEPQAVYAPPEKEKKDILIYAARAHPELSGGTPVITYVPNTLDFDKLYTDPGLYYPRFLRPLP